MVQGLRAGATLEKRTSWVFSIHVQQLTTAVPLAPGAPTAFSGLHRHCTSVYHPTQSVNIFKIKTSPHLKNRMNVNILISIDIYICILVYIINNL